MFIFDYIIAVNHKDKVVVVIFQQGTVHIAVVNIVRSFAIYFNCLYFCSWSITDAIVSGYKGSGMNIYYFLMSVKARSKALEPDCQIAEAIQEL